jgi:hypothetical protein
MIATGMVATGSLFVPKHITHVFYLSLIEVVLSPCILCTPSLYLKRTRQMISFRENRSDHLVHHTTLHRSPAYQS